MVKEGLAEVPGTTIGYVHNKLYLLFFFFPNHPKGKIPYPVSTKKGRLALEEPSMSVILLFKKNKKKNDVPRANG